MTILLKSATIIDEDSPHHLQKKDVLISGGIIKKIADSISETENMRILDFENLHISRGWFDSSVSFGEPGYEERETLENGLETAARSGFTAVALNTNTHPVADSKGLIDFLKSKSTLHPVHLFPVGALTLGGKGEAMAELFDMQNNGAVSFYDYKTPVRNPNLLKVALQYAQSFDALVQSFPFDESVARSGVANEEETSTRLGLKGIPALSEELQIIRDLYILEYTGGKLHIPTISTKKSVELIQKAKEAGLQVSCSVSVSNLILTDSVLEKFDTSYKLLPPLRTQADNEALLQGLKEGIIDGVTSDHNPIDVEHKKIEFDRALFGSIGLESCFGAINKLTDVETAVKALTGLKKIFKIPSAAIEEGEPAELSLFDPEKEWVFKKENIFSTSKNAALLHEKLKGYPLGIISKNKLIVNQ